jgi:hypothetical protein
VQLWRQMLSYHSSFSFRLRAVAALCTQLQSTHQDCPIFIKGFLFITVFIFYFILNFCYQIRIIYFNRTTIKLLTASKTQVQIVSAPTSNSKLYACTCSIRHIYVIEIWKRQTQTKEWWAIQNHCKIHVKQTRTYLSWIICASFCKASF